MSYDVRMQTNHKGVIACEAMTAREVIAYLTNTLSEVSGAEARAIVTYAKDNGVYNDTTKEGNDIWVEHYDTPRNVKRHFISTLFARSTRCGRPANSVETTREFSKVTCAICSGRTSH